MTLIVEKAVSHRYVDENLRIILIAISASSGYSALALINKRARILQIPKASSCYCQLQAPIIDLIMRPIISVQMSKNGFCSIHHAFEGLPLT